MKISDLITQLRFLHANYGDLECVLGQGESIRPLQHPKVRTLARTENGTIPGVAQGEQVSIICARETVAG
jgi:hypothetical protein